MTAKILRRFIPLAFLATALCGLVYLAVQQSLRQGANDPQIQIAEDAAAQLAAGTSTPSGISMGIVNINESLAPYTVMYDANGRPVAGTGMLDGALPNLPAGVFSYASEHGEDRLTWQPRPDLREAIVVAAAANGEFAMSGRSLREVEARENHACYEAAVIWIFTLIGLFILEILFALIKARWMKKK